MATPLGKSITRNQMMGMEQTGQILLPTTEIGGSVSIINTISNDTPNWTDSTIQPTIVHLKQATGTGHSNRNHFPIRILNSGIDVTRSRQNIYNRTGMKPKESITTTMPEYNRANNCNILNSVRKTSYLSCMGLPWHGKMKSEGKDLVDNHRNNKHFRNSKQKWAQKLYKLESHRLNSKLESK